MMLRANPACNGCLQTSLFEGVYKGRDEFPFTIMKVYNLLQHIASDVLSYTCTSGYEGQGSSNFRRGNNCFRGSVTFTQQRSLGDDVVPGSDGRVFLHTMCHNCRKKEVHFRDKCNVIVAGKTSRDTQVALANFTLTQEGFDIIKKIWVLLDTGSTVISVFCNRKLVNNIVHPCKPGDDITAISNGRSESFEEVVDTKILPLTVLHYNAASLANILSLSDISSRHQSHNGFIC